MKKQKFILLLLILTTLLLSATKVYTIVEPTNEFYINDYANILNNETESYIIEKSQELELQTKAQIVVVTINSLEGENLERYATTLFNDFGIGDAEKNNGILFLIALEEREIRLEVGIGLDTYITDNIAGNILDDYVVPYLKGNKRDEGIKNGYNAVYAKLITYYGLDSDVEGKKPFLSNIKERLKSLGNKLLYIILFPILFIVSLIFGKGNSSGRGGGGGGFKGGGGSSRGGGASRRF